MVKGLASYRRCEDRINSTWRLDAQRKIRHWYWASVFNNRYSGAVESTSARDFIDLKAWIDDNAAEPPLVFEFANTFRNLDLRKETKRGTSVYNGIFNLLVIQGARDWISGTVPQHDNLDDHHIVPASWEGAKKLEAGLVHTILNRTPLTAEDLLGNAQYWLFPRQPARRRSSQIAVKQTSDAIAQPLRPLRAGFFAPPWQCAPFVDDALEYELLSLQNI